MKLKGIFITGTALLLSLVSFGQSIEKIDRDLSRLYEQLQKADGEERDEKLAPLFKKNMLEHLKNPVTFQGTFKQLPQHVIIKTSPDKKVKFYGWDDLTGGTWHGIVAIAQFITDNGKIVIQELTSPADIIVSESADFTDSGIYKVYEINSKGTKYYLTFASGTHGSGNQHNIIQIFSICGNRLVKCTDCFKSEQDFIMEYPRGAELNLVFDTVKNEISRAGFEWNNKEDFSAPTGKTIRLKWIDGVFVRQ